MSEQKKVKFFVELTCTKCKSNSCYFFTNEHPVDPESYSFSIRCRDCGNNDDYRVD